MYILNHSHQFMSQLSRKITIFNWEEKEKKVQNTSNNLLMRRCMDWEFQLAKEEQEKGCLRDRRGWQEVAVDYELMIDWFIILIINGGKQLIVRRRLNKRSLGVTQWNSKQYSLRIWVNGQGNGINQFIPDKIHKIATLGRNKVRFSRKYITFVLAPAHNIEAISKFILFTLYNSNARS